MKARNSCIYSEPSALYVLLLIKQWNTTATILQFKQRSELPLSLRTPYLNTICICVVVSAVPSSVHNYEMVLTRICVSPRFTPTYDSHRTRTARPTIIATPPASGHNYPATPSAANTPPPPNHTPTPPRPPSSNPSVPVPTPTSAPAHHRLQTPQPTQAPHVSMIATVTLRLPRALVNRTSWSARVSTPPSPHHRAWKRTHSSAGSSSGSPRPP